MTAIYKREFKSYFRSFIGLLFIAVTLFFVSLYFFVYNMLDGYPYFSNAVSGSVILFLISVPVLTMRILAEEKRNKTDQLILTAPVSVGGIVMGKFLALLTIFAIPTAVICVYPLIMSRFGTIPMADAYVAILGFFLYGMTAIAVGVLVSSLTESQVISSVLSFFILFLMYMMSSICGLISSTGNWLTKLLGCLDMSTPFSELLSGTLNLQAVVYFLSVTALALFLTVQSIQKRRYSVSAKSLSLGAYSTGMIALAAALAVAVNIVAGEIPASLMAVDVTAEKLYSLTDQTKEFVRGIREDVTIYVIAAEDGSDSTVRQTLQRYDDLSEHIRVEYVDPNVNPRFHTQYTDSSISMNSLIVVSEKRNKVLPYNTLYATSYQYDSYTGGYTSSTSGYDGEGQITSALDYVLSDSMPKAYLLEGHGEAALSSAFTDALKKENVDFETVNLLNYEAVPEDAEFLIVNAPVRDFSEDDARKVTEYLSRGGSVIMTAGYAGEYDTPNLDGVLDYMGLSLTDGLVVEQDAQNYYMIPYYLLPILKSGAYTSGIYGQYYVFNPLARGIVIADSQAEGMTYDVFMSSSDESYAKAGKLNMQNYKKADGDEEGPFALGVSAVRTLPEGGEASMALFGCGQIFSDNANSVVSGANLTLFTNAVGGFVDHEVSVSVPVKSYQVSYLMIPRAKAVLVGLITVVIVPVGCLAAGFIIWFGRRKR